MIAYAMKIHNVHNKTCKERATLNLSQPYDIILWQVVLAMCPDKFPGNRDIWMAPKPSLEDYKPIGIEVRGVL